MISINCTMYHDKLRAYVEEVDNPRCTYVGETPMAVDFETTDDDAALANVKAALKATPEFKAVYFQIHKK